MLVQYVPGHAKTFGGFKAKIHHIPINTICQDWLNITTRFLSSADHPIMDCRWVITAPMGSYISFHFPVFEVQNIINAGAPFPGGLP